MIDPFVVERNAEEREQRKLLEQQGVYLDGVDPITPRPPSPVVMQNPDIKIAYSSSKPDVYKVAELELLKLKMNMTLNKDDQAVDRTKLATLIQTLITQGGQT